MRMKGGESYYGAENSDSNEEDEELIAQHKALVWYVHTLDIEGSSAANNWTAKNGEGIIEKKPVTHT